MLYTPILPDVIYKGNQEVQYTYAATNRASFKWINEHYSSNYSSTDGIHGVLQPALTNGMINKEDTSRCRITDSGSNLCSESPRHMTRL